VPKEVVSVALERIITVMHIDTPLSYIHFAYNLIVVTRGLCEKEVNVSLWKRAKRLWTLLTTEEVFDEHGSLGRRKMVRRAPRA
jgi:hypothetical protein